MRSLAVLVLLMSATANAALVTVDAGAYPTGTDLSTVSPGARLSEITNWGVPTGYVAQPVLAVPNGWATGVGPNLIGHNNGKPLIDSSDFRGVRDNAEPCLATGVCNNGMPERDFNALRVSFVIPTNYVEVRAQFPAEAIDGAILRAFNSQGELLTTCRVWGDRPGKHPQYGLFPTLTSPRCGKLLRRYECNSSGSNCNSEHIAWIARVYPDIAYVLWGGEADSATGSAISRVTFRRFSEDCTP